MNKNCYHLEGPGGVKSATDMILQALKEQQPQYIIRADIRSFYKSISHKLLIQEVNRHYQDPKVQEMLKNIIVNPIETPNGYKNPDYGIALRGPLSQFFSGLFLQCLDDAFNDMNVTYIRYNDDLLILCKSLRQLNRCKQRMMKILTERQLKLSRKKTRIGHINQGFHFLGVHYPGTQLQDKATMTQKPSDTMSPTTFSNVYYLAVLRGGETECNLKSSEPNRIVPHARTLRKARENIKSMVNSRVSPRKIIDYLKRWVAWWVKTSTNWQCTELLVWFLESSWDEAPAAYAAGLLQRTFMKSNSC